MKSTNKKMLKLVSASSLALTLSLAVQNNFNNNQENNQSQVVQAATSQVNDYIKAKGFANPAINISPSTFTSDGTYRYGRPEGVVIHETANPTSTIYNEVSYMKNNWDDIGAYVHAFVDKSQVIQIHNPSRSVWGAGAVANKRYIQIELVREKTFDGFARSVNNDAYYVASLLKTYNLPVDSAEYDGAGTVWSHNAVSKFLGGTNHTDPVAYFNSYGYSMDQFIDLVNQKYQALGGNTSSQSPKPEPTPTPSNTVSQYGATEKQYTVKSGTSGYLYSLSSDNKFNQSSPASTLANGQIYSTNTKATYNGETYSLLKNSSNVPFTWIKDADLVEYIKNQDPITSQTGTSLLGTINAGQPIYQYTDEGYKSTTSATNQATLTLTTKAVTKSGKTYYLATLNGQNYGWVSDSSISVVKPEVSNFNSPVTVNGNQPVYYLTGTGFGNAGYSNALSDISQITQKATYNGQTYYLLSNSQGSPLAWVNSNGVSLKARPKPVLSDFTSNATIKGGYNTYYLTSNGFTNAGNSSQLTGINRVLQKATLEGQTYYLVGNGATPIAWIAESGVTLQSNTPAPTPQPEKPSITSFSMSNIQVASNQPAYYLVNNSFSDAGQKSQEFSATQVTQKATYANKTYYLLADSAGTPVVWVSADAVSQKATPAPQPQNNKPTYSDVDQAASLNSNYKTYYMMDSGLVDSGMLTQSVSSAKRVVKKAQIDSKTYYLVSDGQSPLVWVAEAGVNFNTTTNTTPQKPSVSQVTPQNITLKGNQNAYYLMDSFVDAGGSSQFVNLAKQVTAKASYNNQTYYLVSDGQSPLAWVPEAAVSFNANTNSNAKPTASQYTMSDVNQSATIQSNYKIYYLMAEGMVEGGLSQNLQNANSVIKKATYNNQTYYLVSDGQSPLAWISSQGVSLNTNTNSSQQATTSMSGIVTINYPNASIAIWDKPASSTIEGRYLPHGSQWQIFQKQTTADGRVWYCVGTGQWIDAQYANLTN
ncbi:GW dipeptide domain-containing protein [Holzapfeliella sp. He02]|uniref:GW dipeptide domain-containing protein n=1 Tax=Holzapfeliella saturejae TaxID=3082953 RepID=A0ABU8SFH8_9LACO